MAKVTIKFCPEAQMVNFYTRGEQADTARDMLMAGAYTRKAFMTVTGEGEEAAEEVFDLTNNPFRQDERETLYGRGRSVSVGDIVEVDGDNYLCASFGWELIEA